MKSCSQQIAVGMTASRLQNQYSRHTSTFDHGTLEGAFRLGQGMYPHHASLWPCLKQLWQSLILCAGLLYSLSFTTELFGPQVQAIQALRIARPAKEKAMQLRNTSLRLTVSLLLSGCLGLVPGQSLAGQPRPANDVDARPAKTKRVPSSEPSGAREDSDPYAAAAAKLRQEVRATAEKLSPQETYQLFKNLPGGQTVHLRTSDLNGLLGGPLKAGQGNIYSYAALPEPAKQLERIIGGRNFLPAAFLEAGAVRQRAVGRMIFKASHQTAGGTFFPGEAWGTGFLVSPSLLMTNNHVIETAAFAKNKIRIQFNFQRDLLGNPLQTEEYDLDPDSFFRTNPALDYTLVRVKPRTEPAPTSANPLATVEINPGQRWGHIQVETDAVLFLPTDPEEPKQLLNVIQHPNGRMKEIAIHDNFIDELTTDVVRYTTDTEPGSSGSPVFNSLWQLVALHHSAGRLENGVWKNNEGIRVVRIITDLRSVVQPAILGELGL